MGPIGKEPAAALPSGVAALVDVIARMRGTVAVVLGGSRAAGTAGDASDWDLGLYYRGDIDLRPLASYGVVHPPGSWGRLMNGGAWLRGGACKVDVLLRDLDAVDHWSARAEQGDFEVDALLGYLAGAPTYLLMAELASCRALRGELQVRPFPERLAAVAPDRWRFCRSFSLDYARMHARRGDVLGTVGQVAKAALEEAHAVVCARREWVCNEKGLLEKAGLGRLPREPATIPTAATDLVRWVDDIARALGVAVDEANPWR
jgi:hypothetical protein